MSGDYNHRVVMAGLVPAIHDFLVIETRGDGRNAWMAGTSPAMTAEGLHRRFGGVLTHA